VETASFGAASVAVVLVLVLVVSVLRVEGSSGRTWGLFLKKNRSRASICEGDEINGSRQFKQNAEVGRVSVLVSGRSLLPCKCITKIPFPSLLRKKKKKKCITKIVRSMLLIIGLMTNV
jgi:hypothetical protein